MTETVEYAIRCAGGRLIHYGHEQLQGRDAEEVRLIADQAAGARGATPSRCGGKPHVIVSRRRIVTDWEPVGGEQ